MRQKCVLTISIASVMFGACAGVSPLPIARPVAEIPSVELNPGEVALRDAAVDAAITAVVRRRYDEARAAAERALAMDPRAARARSVLGMVMLQEARLVEPPDLSLMNRGEIEVLTAQQLAPQDAFVGWMHAVFLAESGHMSAAAAAAEAALERTKTAPPAERAALLGIAGTYRYELGEDRAALPHLSSYVVLRPDDAAANFRLGSCQLRIAGLVMGPKGPAQAQQSAEAAARSFERSYKLAPGDEDAGLSVGKALLRAADLAGDRGDAAAQSAHQDSAVATFAAVAERFPQSPEPWFCTAIAAERASDHSAARQAYEAALSRDAVHLPSLLNLAVLFDEELPAATSPEAVAEARAQLRSVLQRVLAAVSAGGESAGAMTLREVERVRERLAELDS